MPSSAAAHRIPAGRERPRTVGDGFARGLVIAFLVVLALAGGASRSDEWRTMFARAVACIIVALLAARWWRTRDAVRVPTLGYWLSLAGLAALYLVPLPQAVWSALPGQKPIADFFAASGLGAVWRPVSVSPMLTVNFIGALAPAMAACMLYTAIGEERRRLAVPAVVIFACVSVLWGFLQKLSGAEGLWFYDITNTGRMTGLFSNRNHEAVFAAAAVPLCICEALMGMRGRHKWQWYYLIAAVLLLFGAGLNGSRAGIVAAAIAALASIALVWRHSREGGGGINRRTLALALGAFGLVCLGAFAAASFSEGFSRLLDTDPLQDMRGKIYLEGLRLAERFFPFGSGPGTFEAAYRGIEPDALLGPDYLNEAHNDLLQVFVELGLFAIPLLAWPAVSVFRHTRAAWRAERSGSRMRVLAVLTSLAILAAASLVDYPLRTATCLTFLTLLWCTLVDLGRESRRGGPPAAGPTVAIESNRTC
jgi:hypothetical protein